MKSKALFAGTFDPFTIGHESIVHRGLKIFDQMVIGIGINQEKKSCFSIEDRLEFIRETFKNNSKIEVYSYEGLTVDFAKEMQATALIRGVRSVLDFEYEKQISDINRKISGLETVILFTEPEISSIQSATVRELLKFGKDVGSFVPKSVAKLIKQIK